MLLASSSITKCLPRSQKSSKILAGTYSQLVKSCQTRYTSSKSGLWSQDSNDGTEKTNRWSMLVPAVATHISLGAPYGWSAISATVAREYGFVTAGAADWSLDLATYPMSIMVKDLSSKSVSYFVFSLQLEVSVQLWQANGK